MPGSGGDGGLPHGQIFVQEAGALFGVRAAASAVSAGLLLMPSVSVLAARVGHPGVVWARQPGVTWACHVGRGGSY